MDGAPGVRIEVTHDDCCLQFGIIKDLSCAQLLPPATTRVKMKINASECNLRSPVFESRTGESTPYDGALNMTGMTCYLSNFSGSQSQSVCGIVDGVPVAMYVSVESSSSAHHASLCECCVDVDELLRRDLLKSDDVYADLAQE